MIKNSRADMKARLFTTTLINRMKSISILTILFLLATIQGAVYAQAGDSVYIEETGIWIEGDIYDYYKQADDPENLFGPPISQQFTDPISGNTTQYFQNARFDLISDTNGSSVKLAPLGELLYEDIGLQAENLPVSGSCQKIGSSKYKVCFAFIEFYQANNGRNYFGLPISDIEIREGHFVQYFENVRLEWQPEHQNGAQIVVSDLGKTYYNSMSGRIHAASELQETGMMAEKIKLNSHVFVANTHLLPNSQQTLYILATDQQTRPVEGAMIGVTVHLPNKDTFYRPPSTDADGISTLTFSIGDIQFNEIVTIDVSTSFQEMEINNSTWFRVWK